MNSLKTIILNFMYRKNYSKFLQKGNFLKKKNVFLRKLQHSKNKLL